MRPFAHRPYLLVATLAFAALATPALARKHSATVRPVYVPAPQNHPHDVPKNTQKPDKHAHVPFETQASSHAKTEAWQVKEHYAYDKKHHIVQTN